MDVSRVMVDNLPNYNNCGSCTHSFWQRLYHYSDHKTRLVWYGIKGKCCRDENIVFKLNGKHGQCMICMRLFIR